jgi:hypothetical protein
VADCSILKESAGVRPHRAPYPKVLVKVLLIVLLKGFVKVLPKDFLKAPGKVVLNALVKVEVLRSPSWRSLVPR